MPRITAQRALVAVNTIGIILLFVGVSLKDHLPSPIFDQLTDSLGIAAVLISVLAFLGSIQQTSDRTIKSIQDCAADVARINDEVKLQMAEIRRIREVTVDTSAGQIDAAIQVLLQDDKPLHKSSSLLLRQLTTKRLPNLALDLKKLDDLERCNPIQIQDIRAISTLLDNLTDELKTHPGAAWLGTSRMLVPEAWDPRLTGWNERLLQVAAQAPSRNEFDIFVCRLFLLTPDREVAKLLPEMRRQMHCGAIVRYALISNGAEEFPDVSLIWLPPTSPRTKVLRQDLEQRPARALTRAGYQPLPGLEFDIGASLSLRSVDILPRLPETRDRADRFDEIWTRSSIVTD
jgi:hypothetical protein